MRALRHGPLLVVCGWIKDLTTVILLVLHARVHHGHLVVKHGTTTVLSEIALVRIHLQLIPRLLHRI